MSDAFTPYETGLARFLERLGQDHPRYTEALTLEAQLRENVGQARLDGDSETRRADRNRILRGLNRLALQTVRLSFNDLCGFPGGEADGAQPRAADAPLQRGFPIGFVNREHELLLLKVERLKAARSPYTLISAPAGYGKSRLLLHLVQTLAADEAGEYTREAGEYTRLRPKWSVRYVECAPQPADQVACVVHALAGPAAPDEPGAAIDLVCDAVVQDLGALSPEGRRGVLLMFDAVERLSGETRRWLATLLNDLRRRTRPGDQEVITVRVILAGRDVESFWEDYARAHPRPPAPQRMDLSPFDERSIQEMVWGQAQAVHVADRLDDQTVTQIADELRYLSGGHPGILCDLVDDLARRSFAIGPAAGYFGRRREELVCATLSPVADDLVGALETGTGEAVRTLSIFRQVNANTVQALVQEGLLPPQTNAIALLGDLQRAHLLDGPGIREPFYRDRWMRRILALDMAYRSPASRARYLRLNKVALHLYHNWIHNLGPALLDTHLKPAQRLLSVLEWLFHALQDEDLDAPTLCAELRRHVQALSVGSEQPPVADLIADEIRKDDEVCYLLRHRLGDDGVSDLCGWLSPYVPVEGGTANG